MTLAHSPLIMTAGDPSGIGPELTIKAYQHLAGRHAFVVIGDVTQMRDLAKAAGIPTHQIETPSECRADALCIIPQTFSAKPEAGCVQPENAAGTIQMIERAVAFVKSGAGSAVVTNPINKKVLVDGAGFPHPGHTEFLAALDGKDRSVMLLASDDLRVVPATIHVALQDVPQLLTKTLISDTVRILDRALRTDLGFKAPRIAVAGLNPHAGEGGQMGFEELQLIAPTLDKLRNEGFNLVGPVSADTMFHQAARKTYDAALCMYHDQALIPIKTIAFDRGVNATLGLSFIRTSPDHGTAYDIAGKGIATPSSLIEAVKLAAEMVENRARS